MMDNEPNYIDVFNAYYKEGFSEYNNYHPIIQVIVDVLIYEYNFNYDSIGYVYIRNIYYDIYNDLHNII